MCAKSMREAYKNAKAIDEKPDATSEEVETAYKTLIEVGKRLTMYKGGSYRTSGGI